MYVPKNESAEQLEIDRKLAKELTDNSTLVQLKGAQVFFSRIDLDIALIDYSKITSTSTTLKGKGERILMNKKYNSVSVLGSVKIDNWVIEEYKKWMEKDFDDVFNSNKHLIQSFWGTDTRIGMVIPKEEYFFKNYNSETIPYRPPPETGVVKVRWFNDKYPVPDVYEKFFGNESYHHVNSLQDVAKDGPMEKLFYAVPPPEFG